MPKNHLVIVSYRMQVLRNILLNIFHSNALQVLIPDDLIGEMVNKFEHLAKTIDGTNSAERKVFEWPKYNLKLIIDTPTPDNQGLI